MTPSTGQTILIVEDNELNMKLFSSLLDAQGYHLRQARSGREAMAMVQQQHPDLILMDMQLPEMSGIEVTQWLKKDEKLKAIPVVAVTAFAMKGDEEKIRAVGCDDYLAKPISITKFLSTVERYIGPGPGHHEKL